MTAESDIVVQLTQERVNTANSAAYEIELIILAARRYIDAQDGIGEIHPLMRGLAARVVALTSAIARALDPKDDDQEWVENTVYVSDVAKLVNRS